MFIYFLFSSFYFLQTAFWPKDLIQLLYLYSFPNYKFYYNHTHFFNLLKFLINAKEKTTEIWYKSKITFRSTFVVCNSKINFFFFAILGFSGFEVLRPKIDNFKFMSLKFNTKLNVCYFNFIQKISNHFFFYKYLNVKN